MAAAGYPRRPAFFANRLVRLLFKTCAAQTIGPDGVALLACIAMTEDAARYRRPVTFHNNQLMTVLGIRKWERLDRIRDKCISAGWLTYTPPPNGSRRAGEYFVKVPAYADGLDDLPTDEGARPSPDTGDGQPEPSPKTGNGLGYGLGDGLGEPSSYSCPDPKSSRPAQSVVDAATGKTPKNRQRSYTPEDMATAEYIWSAIRAMQPDRRPPDLSQWANTIRLMRERDGRTHDQTRDCSTARTVIHSGG